MALDFDVAVAYRALDSEHEAMERAKSESGGENVIDAESLTAAGAMRF